jgi:hypothetical protein
MKLSKFHVNPFRSSAAMTFELFWFAALSCVVATSSNESAHLPSTTKSLPVSLIIRQTPEEPVVIEGIPLQLDCQLDHQIESITRNTSEVHSTRFGMIPTHLCFQWFVNGQPISDDPRRYQNGPRLHIASVRHSLDLGEYKCSVSDSNSGLRIQSDPFVLNILCKFCRSPPLTDHLI